jgi:hypothetical protein
VPNNRHVGKLISLTVLISSSTGEGSVQDIGNLAIRGVGMNRPQHNLVNEKQYSSLLQ